MFNIVGYAVQGEVVMADVVLCEVLVGEVGAGEVPVGEVIAYSRYDIWHGPWATVRANGAHRKSAEHTDDIIPRSSWGLTREVPRSSGTPSVFSALSRGAALAQTVAHGPRQSSARHPLRRREAGG